MFATTQLTMRYYLGALRRRWPLLAAALAVAAVAVVVPATLEDPVYTSTVTVRVSSGEPPSIDPDADAEVADAGALQSEVIELGTDVQMVRSAEVRRAVEDALGEDADEVRSVAASLVGYSSVIRVEVTADDAELAAEAAEAYASAFVALRQQESVEPLRSLVAAVDDRRQRLEAEIAEIDAQLADASGGWVNTDVLRDRRSGLEEQMADLELRTDALDVEIERREGATRILTPAGERGQASEGGLLRELAIGLVLGLAAGIGLIALLELVQDRVSGVEELDHFDADVPLLASVPGNGDESALRPLATAFRLRTLRSPVRSVAVTGASGGATTRAAIDLARAMAAQGEHVLLVDARLGDPAVHAAFRVDTGIGVPSVLGGGHALEDAVHQATVGLDVLPGEPGAATDHEALGSREFAAMLESAAGRYDLVVIDTPPVSAVTESLFVADLCDGSIVVVEMGTARRSDVRSTITRLRESGSPVLGLVAVVGGTSPLVSP